MIGPYEISPRHALYLVIVPAMNHGQSFSGFSSPAGFLVTRSCIVITLPYSRASVRTLLEHHLPQLKEISIWP